ncbi:MAG: hypothetical protein HKN43_09090 [Rhodothermales bacterium]|nr:hypothetical protein [Rhodothermales bacterium]
MAQDTRVRLRYETARMNDAELIGHFNKNPEEAYAELLKRFSPVIIRMIRRFMNDQDEVMEVYTAVAERLRAKRFKALREFRISKEITPWLSVVVANACRDRFRKNKYVSMPQSVIDQLTDHEKLVFKYYYQDQMIHSEIVEMLSATEGQRYTSLDVAQALDKINDLLSVNKRWHLLMALHQNKAMLSIEDLQNLGFEAPSGSKPDRGLEPTLEKERIDAINAAMAELDPEDQLLLLLRFEHGMRASEIAEAMSFENHKYVYTRLRTIVNRLKRMIEES